MRELTVITKRILCHAKKLSRPAENHLFSMTSFCLVSCRRSGVVCWPDFCSVCRQTDMHNSYLRRTDCVHWECWYSWFPPQVRTNGTAAISRTANIEAALNVLLCGWEIPNLVLCESEKNIPQSHLKRLFWMGQCYQGTNKTPISHQYDTKITKLAFFNCTWWH